jgi:hypothetical protein
MAWEHEKSATTVLCDTIRWLLICFGTGVVLYYIGKYSLALAVIAAIPVFVVMLNLIGFLTLPLYFLTPERKAVQNIARSLKKGDMESFGEQVRAFERDFNVKTPDDSLSDIQHQYQDLEELRK